MLYTSIALFYLDQCPKHFTLPVSAMWTHSQTDDTLEPAYNHQEQWGVECLTQGFFATWVGKAASKPTIFSFEFDCSTSTLSYPEPAEKMKSHNASLAASHSVTTSRNGYNPKLKMVCLSVWSHSGSASYHMEKLWSNAFFWQIMDWTCWCS